MGMDGAVPVFTIGIIGFWYIYGRINAVKYEKWKMTEVPDSIFAILIRNNVNDILK